MRKATWSGPGQFTDSEKNEVHFRKGPSHVPSKVCMCFIDNVPPQHSSAEIPEFPVASEIALELLMAVNFLDS